MAFTLTLKFREMEAVATVLANAVAASDWEDPDTFHGGLGADQCEFCTTLLKMIEL